MKKRMTALLVLSVFFGLCVFAAFDKERKKTAAAQISGKTFFCEKGGFGGDFTLTLQRDGSYTYYEGMLSSYIGRGHWKVEDGILVLEEEGGYDLHFLFVTKNGTLVYRKEGSDSFLYVRLEDGDRFLSK